MARETDAELAFWIEEACRFPCSMVDRITPAASEETFALAEQARGRPDPAAIETEPFRQWVIEDCFAGPRPDWEAAGALIVPDVAPFETMKLRLLNGAHSLLAYLGALAGLPAVRDVMADEALRKAVRGHMEAVSATLPELPGFDAADYADALIARFENKAIDHRCLQIAMDGSQKLAQRIFSPAKELLESGGDIRSCALAVAAWIRFTEGRTDSGAALELNDPLADEIRSALSAAGSRASAKVEAMAGLSGLAHQGVLDDQIFAAAVAETLDLLTAKGVRGAVQR
jgi:fructuronate reductase